MKPLFRYLPLALAAFALHAQAQSVSPAYEAFRNKEAPQPAPTQAATPTTQPAAPAPAAAPAYAAPAPYVAPAPAREAEENGGFFVGLQAGQGWIYEDVEQDTVAVSAGYRWQAGPWAQVGVELSGGRLDSTNYRGYDVSKATYKAVGANARMNFGDSPWFATVRGGYFDAEQEYSDSTFSTDGGYAGLAIGVDINRHFNVSLGYTAFVYADEYADEDCDDYDYDCDFNRADTVMLGIEARF
ncbi:outer membrane beta-barrel protein [Pseudoxanthomonas sp. PXM02]|uniref:outer membrane beta-barrel protein n=1 Tax=Pseudoxanthomonas sp. PXM02 TaxID=2769294 RepID=UPI00178693C3|nr:outer membrane beta-barrel protein [Pseudoxanthomonas sp. PXM02]MBD9480828.1 outer membrane beta-barrel protein [Pseudoxanthomonas sp. PXM02]